MITIDVTVRTESRARRAFRWTALYVIRPLVILATVAFVLCGGFILLLPFAFFGQIRWNTHQYMRRRETLSRARTETYVAYDPRNPYDGI